MKVTQLTKDVLASRRERKAMTADGWEFLSEGGGNLWEIHRGWRVGQRIIDCKASVNGMGVWVKVGKPTA